MLLLMLTTPYARTTGLGAVYAAHLPRWPALAMLGLVAAVLIVSLGAPGLVIALLLGGVLVWLSATLIARIGGYTGDTLGAACELSETLALMALVLLSG
jgi:adenosylcobinamide-GDP ribazoletransferase